MSEECKAAHPDPLAGRPPMPPVVVVKLRVLSDDKPFALPADSVVIIRGIPGSIVNLSRFGLPYELEFVNVRPLRHWSVTLT